MHYYYGTDGGEEDATVGRDAEVQEDAHITPDASVLQLEASISSASLASDCGSAERPGLIGDCAPPPEDCEGEACYCGLPCQQSNMQLSLKIDGIRGGTTVEVVKVELFPTTDDLPGPLDTLSAYEPKVWDGETYSAWDEQLAPGTETKVSYNLTAPDWEQIGGGEPWQTYSMTFSLRVTLKINGEAVTLNSDEIMREPEIVT